MPGGNIFFSAGIIKPNTSNVLPAPAGVENPGQLPKVSGYVKLASSTIASNVLPLASPFSKSINSCAVNTKDKSDINPVATACRDTSLQPPSASKRVAAAASSSSSEISESQKDAR